MGRASAKWVAFWAAAGLFFLISAVGTWGFAHSCGYPPSGAAAITDALYRSLQLFLLNYVPYECAGAPNTDLNLALQSARFLAPAFATGAVILSLVEPLRDYLRLLWQRGGARRRVIVIGYGAPGEAIARRFAQTSLVTVIAREPDKSGRQRPPLGRLLVSDGSDGLQAALRRVHADQAQRVFVTGANDMQALDAAHETQVWLARRTSARVDLRVILREPEIAREVADVSASGGGLWRDISAYAAPQMSAEGLVQRARFDRTALEAGQPCVHIALFGCTDQGEAIITEVLLTAWRVDLGPPRICVFDAATGAMEARLRTLAPALFSSSEGAGLPPGSAPAITFHSVDFAQIDCGAIGSPLHTPEAPITAYIFAHDDDTANFRAALELESAMLQRRIAAAPIYVRLWNAHQGAAANPGFSATSLIRAFGSLNALVDHGIAFDVAPDAQARHLHHAYLSSCKTMQQLAQDQGETFDFTSTPWDDLPETLRVSNRRLHRHSVQKLEDLGLQWRLEGLHLPEVSSADRARLVPSPLLDRVAAREHDRWMCERALDGWRPGTPRDDDRRIHPSICGWGALDATTQNHDRVFARSLLEHHAAQSPARLSARPRHLAGMVLIPALSPGKPLTWLARTTLEQNEPGVSELVVGIAWPPVGQASTNPASLNATIAQAGVAALTRVLRDEPRFAELCRLRFVFTRPPDEALLRLMELIAGQAALKSCEISVQWLWGRVATGSAPADANPENAAALWAALGLAPGGARPLHTGALK